MDQLEAANKDRPVFPGRSSFLHPVGQSTVRQGLTIPKTVQVGWLADIEKGQKVPVTIRFSGEQTVTASLRRLNNERGHLQLRYEGRAQAPLREYLSAFFAGSDEPKNAVLRVTEVQPRLFSFEVLSETGQGPAVLNLCVPHFHNCAREVVESLPEFKELGRSFLTVRYDEEANQSEYNRRIAAALHGLGWKTETRILNEIGLRCDFQKNGVWVEVEFGNARAYYQDYVKFLIAARHRQAKLGVLLCPTSAFAQLLCKLGKRRAIARRKDGAGRHPSYSGMMHVEKALRELPFLQFMLTSGIVIAGIEIVQGERR